MSAASVSGRGGGAPRDQGGKTQWGLGGGTRGAHGQRARRARPVLALAAVAFAAGAMVGSEHSSPSPAPGLAARFVGAWARGDYATMYSEIAPPSQREVSVDEFAQDYREALMTATAAGMRVMGTPRGAPGNVEVVPVRVRTRLFGTLAESFRLPLVAEPDEGGERVVWSRSLTFPGLRAGELLSRHTSLPPRAALLARDGSPLAEGPASAAGDRGSPLGEVASAVAGEVGPIPAASRPALEAQGVPGDAIVGVSGLELAEDERLRGTPGGELLAVRSPIGQSPTASTTTQSPTASTTTQSSTAGTPAQSPTTSTATQSSTAGTPAQSPTTNTATQSSTAGTTAQSPTASTAAEGGGRVLASAAPHAGSAVRTTISPALQSAAVSALGGQYGGVIAMEPASGGVLAVAGIGLDTLQPPGSTFKMITVSGVLQAGIASPRSTFPYATAATLDGVQLHNANGEECGGSLVEAFAVSCNSVFSPLGVKLGAARLVATAERFGFNHPPGIAGAAQSTIPPAADIQGELAVGSTAIGQDQVLASPLEMATVAATIAYGGLRPTPSLLLAPSGVGGSHHAVRAVSAGTARTVRGMMIDVVRYGTGTAAAIPGVVVAGKTGTAELGPPAGSSSCATAAQKPTEGAEQTTGEHASESGGCTTEQSNPQDTDAWFAAFAPAVHPKIAVAVLLVRDGAGGATAAPVARQVIEAGLKAGGLG
ncbi:MAG TPA: penicillin-binding transpeptidase domain-containing protein [Solirubrobacteraceae bacterium]|jgi:peptidoglycan glycosyltransferase|nr:penicillin-binding transpeptidase domain-containing protein [Solirubrobacteraceae bacterium]